MRVAQPNETELGHRWRGRAWANTENRLIKLNVDFTAASGLPPAIG